MKHKIKIRRISNLNGAKLDNENYIYVGRGSKYLKESVLHNSYKVKDHGLRRSLEIYRIWLNKAIEARHEEYEELIRMLNLLKEHDITLVCFCINSDNYEDDKQEIKCHAQIIRRALLYLDSI